MSNKTQTTLSIKNVTLETLKKNAIDLIEKSNKNFYELGETLNLVKSLMEHNKFSTWVNEELDFSHNLANKYMKIAAALDQETAVKLKVRKSYALATLDNDARNIFLAELNEKEIKIDNLTCKDFEKKVSQFKLLNKDEEVLLEKEKLKNSRKAIAFVKNIDSLTMNLSNQISTFMKYKSEINDKDLLNTINRKKAIFDKLEELNALINESTSNYEFSLNSDISNEQRTHSFIDFDFDTN